MNLNNPENTLTSVYAGNAGLPNQGTRKLLFVRNSNLRNRPNIRSQKGKKRKSSNRDKTNNNMDIQKNQNVNVMNTNNNQVVPRMKYEGIEIIKVLPANGIGISAPITIFKMEDPTPKSPYYGSYFMNDQEFI